MLTSSLTTETLGPLLLLPAAVPSRPSIESLLIMKRSSIKKPISTSIIIHIPYIHNYAMVIKIEVIRWIFCAGRTSCRCRSWR
ncbi:hypothetical protein BS47DRAFT_1380524 [Hydnum rufescens UP504]|uniref:Uncharacterized protein n=1 Tax=Hydnum rufescens UP504 TaxID=1448309 RepID=A0A9P6B5R2_9AGAM|nr:hypothetical protein BS47DRAFT_1380524 [Hydnum rufescens UP504]